MARKKVISNQNKSVKAGSKELSNYDKDPGIKGKNTRAPNNYESHSRTTSVGHSRIAKSGSNVYDKGHETKKDPIQNVLSKRFSVTNNKLPNRATSVESNVSKKKGNNCFNTKMEENIFSHSDDNIGNDEKINDYKAVFYKDICISGKNLSLWKRIKYRFRSFKSTKESDSYTPSGGLDGGLSKCGIKKKNVVTDNLKTQNYFDTQFDAPYFNKYVTMHLNVEKSDTHFVHNCYSCGDNNKRNMSKINPNNDNKVYSTVKGTCMHNDKKCTILPVVNFSNNSLNSEKTSVITFLKEKVFVVLDQILSTLLETNNCQCKKPNTECRRYNTVAEEKNKICKCVPNARDKLMKTIPHNNIKKNTCCGKPTPGCKQKPNNLQDISLKKRENIVRKESNYECKCFNTECVAKPKDCSRRLLADKKCGDSEPQDIISTTIQKNKNANIVRKESNCECKYFNTECVIKPKDCSHRLLIDKKYGDSEPQDIISTTLKKNKNANIVRKESNYKSTCVNAQSFGPLKDHSRRLMDKKCGDSEPQGIISKPIGKKKIAIILGKDPNCKSKRVNTKSFVTPKDYGHRLIDQKCGDSEPQDMRSKPIHKKYKLAKCSRKDKGKKFKECILSYKNSNYLCGDNKQKAVGKTVRKRSPVLPKHNKHQLKTKRDENSCTPQNIFPYPNFGLAKLGRYEILQHKSNKSLTHCNKLTENYENYNIKETECPCHNSHTCFCATSLQDKGIRNQCLSKNNMSQINRRKSCSSCISSSKENKKKHKYKKNCHSQTKNALKTCKSAQLDMNKGRKISQGVCDCHIQSSCRPGTTDLNSRCTQHSMIMKHHAMNTEEAQAGDGPKNFRSFSKTLSLNYQISPRCQCKSTNCSNNLLRVPSKEQNPQKHVCTACPKSFSSNGCLAKSLQFSPQICKCTKYLNKTGARKPRAANVVKRKCKNKTQMCPSLTGQSNRNKGALCCLKKICKLKEIESIRRKSSLQLDYECSNLYEYTLKQGSPPMSGWMCPAVSPKCYNFDCMYRQCLEMMFLTCMFCLWCPCLFIFEFCRMCFCR